jgi:hypothetical protein
MQTIEYALSPVAVSNTRGAACFVLGYLEDDAQLRQAAMQASSSGSQMDMYMHVWEAAIREDIVQVKRGIEQMVSRYQSSSRPDSGARKVLTFLPLVPALKDPTHSSRTEALRHFGNDPTWAVLRWIWINKYNLPKGDAITFLGGRETDAFRHILVCSLEEKPEEAELALKSFLESAGTFDDKGMLAHYVTRKLRKTRFDKPEPDLKPEKLLSVREAVLAKLEAKSR